MFCTTILIAISVYNISIILCIIRYACVLSWPWRSVAEQDATKKINFSVNKQNTLSDRINERVQDKANWNPLSRFMWRAFPTVTAPPPTDWPRRSKEQSFLYWQFAEFNVGHRSKDAIVVLWNVNWQILQSHVLWWKHFKFSKKWRIKGYAFNAFLICPLRSDTKLKILVWERN